MWTLLGKRRTRSFPCVVIGYNSFHKGYRFHQQSKRKVFVSRHVIFDENIMPYVNPDSYIHSMETNTDMTTYYEFMEAYSTHNLDNKEEN